MKRILLLSLILLFTDIVRIFALGEIYNESKEFDTVFKDMETGNFMGTINGIIIIKTADNNTVLLDFQGSKADLNIIPDEDKVYDISWKRYGGVTTRGKTKLTYSTYAWANEITITLDNVEYSKSNLDGGCFRVIEGLDYYYIAEKEYEYLILKINEPIDLSNWQYLLRNTDENNRCIEELKKKESKLTILPNSVIVFAINRNGQCSN